MRCLATRVQADEVPTSGMHHQNRPTATLLSYRNLRAIADVTSIAPVSVL
jgi:hypothetical protein